MHPHVGSDLYQQQDRISGIDLLNGSERNVSNKAILSFFLCIRDLIKQSINRDVWAI